MQLHQVLHRQEYCEKYDNTGLYNVGENFEGEEYGPCRIEEELPKKKTVFAL